MQIFTYFNNFKTTILFIHGYNKSYNDFNITEHNKEIGIELNVRKIRNTILVSLDKEDYLVPIIDISNKIYEAIQKLANTKIICVCHSYGTFYATSLAIQYPNLLSCIIMLEPTIKTNDFLEYLKTLEQDEHNKYKIEHFGEFPNYLAIPKTIALNIHLNIDLEQNKINKIIELDHIVKKNVKSKLMVHVNVSHMIHYKIPHVIIDNIRNI